MADENRNPDIYSQGNYQNYQNPQNFQSPQGFQNPQDFQQAVNNAVKEQKKKKRKTILLILVIVFSLLIIIAALSGNSGSDSPKETGEVSSEEAENQVEESKPENNVAGKYNVKFKSAKITENGGTDYLIVTYTFTNNSNKNASFEYTIDCKAFQNGIELGPVYVTYGIEGFDIQLQRKELQPGKSLDVQEVYELNDKQTDIDIQVHLWADFTDKIYDNFTIKIKQ